MYIRAYGPTVSGRDRGIPKLRTGANTLIRTLAGGENFTTTAGCRTTARPRTATIQEQTLLFFWGGRGDGGSGQFFVWKLLAFESRGPKKILKTGLKKGSFCTFLFNVYNF
jgi:hypothetical protein